MKKTTLGILAAVFLAMAISCSSKKTETAQQTDSTQVSKQSNKELFGTLPDGQSVYRYTLTNKNGLEVKVINLGGIITSIVAPDKNGVKEDIVLGFDSLSGYLKNGPYFGAIVGRHGNRIAKGKFKLDGKEYTLAKNNGENHLHGGVKGFDKVYWNVEEATSLQGQQLKLTYHSKDMEEGYPGNLDVTVTYTLTDKNELKINYTATTDKPTIVNLTQHTYFNLTGNTKRDILDHQVQIRAEKMVPVDKDLIPTGKLMNVAGTPFDFNKATMVGAKIDAKDQQVEFGRGYDHCWVLSAGDTLKPAATVLDPLSGRVVEMYTTEPGVQFYTGNFLDGKIKGKGGVVYQKRFGLCLETEHFPDSPNQPTFPSIVLKPGEIYHSETTYVFSAQ